MFSHHLFPSKERNTFVPERFNYGLVTIHGKHYISTDGGIWYQMACRFLKLKLKLKPHIPSSFEKSLIERKMQYVKDRTKELDKYLPFRKNDCKLSHVRKWLNLF